MNLLTIIVLIVFALFLLRGWQRGFIKSLASMFSLILSLMLVNVVNPYVTEFLKTQTPVYDYILEKCEDAFTIKGADGTTKISEEQQESLIDSLSLPKTIKEALKENNTPQYYTQLAAKNLSDYVQKYMAGLILTIVSYIVTLILILSFVALVVAMLDIISKLPVLRGINQLLGLGLGFFQGLIIVWIGFLIITIISHTAVGQELMQMILDSPILSKIYDANALLKALQKSAVL